MKNVISLQKKYPRFIYQKYSYWLKGKELKASFRFKIEPDISFKARINIKNVPAARLKKMDQKALNNFVFHLGLIEIPSYWKATCSPEIAIRAGFLTKEQTAWWKELILNGMGQFFYENKIDFRGEDFLKVLSNPSITALPLGILDIDLKDRYLVPMGGGKDSIVTLEKLKKRGKSLNCFLLNPKKQQKKVLKVAGIKKPIVAERRIDPKLLELNQAGYLNGHTPFTAVLSFLSVFCGVLFDYKNIVFSNEKSADEGNTRYLGKTINHQWAKSSEFEKMFKLYIKKYLTPGVKCFSFLRKYGELEISKMFVKYPKYFPVFSSCNKIFAPTLRSVGAKENWCGECPKCLFVYAALYPYLEKKELKKIFGNDIFDPSTLQSYSGQASSGQRKLLLIMKELLGMRKHKPFECVGTYRESKRAFDLSLAKAKQRGRIPYLLKKYDDVKRTKR